MSRRPSTRPTRRSATVKSPAQHLDAAIKIFSSASAKWESDNDLCKETETAITTSLERTCAIIAETAAAATCTAEEFGRLLKRASDHENKVVNFAYDDFETDFLSPYCGKVVKDESMGIGIGMNGLQGFAKLLQKYCDPGKQPQALAAMYDKLGGSSSKPYSPDSKPSPHSTPIARFRDGRPAVPSNASDTLRAVCEARCEVSSTGIYNPIQIAVSPSLVVVAGCGGWKERDPTLDLYDLADVDDMPEGVAIRETGLQETATELLIDEVRHIVFIADSHRIKGFQSDLGVERVGTLKHTLNCSDFSGALALCGGGTRLIRAGEKKIGVWDVGALPTHGEDGSDILGESMDAEDLDTWRDSSANIELSTGTICDRSIALGQEFAGDEISKWALHPSDPSSMICGFEEGSRCLQLDLQSGKVASRWLGHGGVVTQISTNLSDPHTFLTSAEDGVTRLYDVRRPTPTLALYSMGEHVSSSLLIDIDGFPFIVTGGTRSEQIKVWDVRAERPLYELATGNNEAVALAWDAPRTTLYAATSCSYMDRLGGRFDYRRAKIKHGNDDEDGDDSEDFYDRGWPERAYHDEKSFGYPFDSGEHRLFRYVFKSDADISVLPDYGGASANERGGW